MGKLKREKVGKGTDGEEDSQVVGKKSSKRLLKEQKVQQEEPEPTAIMAEEEEVETSANSQVVLESTDLNVVTAHDEEHTERIELDFISDIGFITIQQDQDKAGEIIIDPNSERVEEVPANQVEANQPKKIKKKVKGKGKLKKGKGELAKGETKKKVKKKKKLIKAKDGTTPKADSAEPAPAKKVSGVQGKSQKPVKKVKPKVTTEKANEAASATPSEKPKKRVIKYARPGDKPAAEINTSTGVKLPHSSPSAAPTQKTTSKNPTKKIIKIKVKEGSEQTDKPVVSVKKKVKKKKKKPADPEPEVKKVDEIIFTKQPVLVQLATTATPEMYTIRHLYQEMRESCVISDRWCIPEPMWDPHTNHEVMLCYELDVLMDGSVRMKRCIKILDNFELIVLLDGSDKTQLFRDKHPTINSSQELLDLIRKVTMVKVCSGVPQSDTSDVDNMSVKVISRGGSWFSSECNVEVERGCLGNICKKCTSLRNTIRRKMRRQFGVDNPNPTPNRSLLSSSLKPVVRSLGEALYSNLHHMSRSNRIDDELPIIPLPRSSDQVLHPEMKIYMNSELKQRLDEVSANPAPLTMAETQIVEIDARTMTRTIKRIHTPILPTSFRSSLSTGGPARGGKRMKTAESVQNQSFVVGSNGELTLVQTPSSGNEETIQLPEGYVLAEDGSAWGDNVVVQKLDPSQEDQIIIGEDNSIVVGSNFTLEDGEEYEVIGEAAAGSDGEAIQVLPLNTNSDIEIIEVDENMIHLVDENSQPEIQPIDSSSDIFKFLQAHSRLQV